MRLKYTIGGVVLVLVSPLFCHSLLTLPLEAKLTLVTLSPTIVTMKSYGLRLRLGMGMLTWFLPTQILTLLLSNLTLLGAHKLHRFMEIICRARKYGRIWVSSLFFSGLELEA
jgi:hypothetical protein